MENIFLIWSTKSKSFVCLRIVNHPIWFGNFWDRSLLMTNLIVCIPCEDWKSQSYYGPKLRKPHDSYGFLHWGKHVTSLHSYRNEENRTNRVVFLILARNSSDHFQISHGILFKNYWFVPKKNNSWMNEEKSFTFHA